MDLDLAIVGGGPAGVATALFLAEAAPALAARVAILEKARYPREKICAGAIGARADRLLASIGVRVEVPGVPVYGLSVATGAGALAAREEAPIGRVVRRFEFDRALAEAARARGVRIVEGARVSGVAIDAAGVRIASSVGEIRARAIVGADGVGSVVRRAIGAPRGRLRAQVVEVDTEAAAGDPPRALLHFDWSDRSLPGYAWDFPTLVGGRALVCRGLYALRIDQGDEDDEDVAARLAARLDRLGVARAGLKFKRFAERGLALHEPLARPRALLVGEAAGIDPVLGEGIAQAIFYGAAAGPYLARRLAAGALGFEDWPRALWRSRVGLDLGVRSLATRWVYGATRPVVERWVASSGDLARAGMRYFAGERVPRLGLARAAIALGRAAIAPPRA